MTRYCLVNFIIGDSTTMRCAVRVKTESGKLLDSNGHVHNISLQKSSIGIVSLSLYMKKNILIA
jgi:hypothetical protein